MSFRNFMQAAAIVVAASAVAYADHAVVKEELGHYYPIRALLAGDKTDGLKEHADALAKSKDKDVAKAATALAGAKDIAAARKAFGDLSKALIAEVEAAQKKGADVGMVYVFECPMAKPYG